MMTRSPTESEAQVRELEHKLYVLDPSMEGLYRDGLEDFFLESIAPRDSSERRVAPLPTRERLTEVFNEGAEQIDREHALYVCYACGSTDIEIVRRQIRSADEGMSSFMTCRGCGNKWSQR